MKKIIGSLFLFLVHGIILSPLYIYMYKVKDKVWYWNCYFL